MSAASAATLIAGNRKVIRAVATSVVPESVDLAESDWADFERIIEKALSERPARMRRQLSVFLKLIDLLSLLRHGRHIHSLDVQRRTQLFERLERSGLLLLRRGFWGVRTLTYMGYYGRPAAASGIGYRATTRGWEAVSGHPAARIDRVPNETGGSP